MASLQTVLIYSACVLISCFVLATTAPTNKNRRLANDDENLSAILSALSNDRELADAPLRRTRRHASDPTLDNFDELDADEISSPTSHRRRNIRSASLFVSATVALCMRYPNYCRRIEVEDSRIKIRLVEE